MISVLILLVLAGSIGTALLVAALGSPRFRQGGRSGSASDGASSGPGSVSPDHTSGVVAAGLYDSGDDSPRSHHGHHPDDGSTGSSDHGSGGSDAGSDSSGSSDSGGGGGDN